MHIPPHSIRCPAQGAELPGPFMQVAGPQCPASRVSPDAVAHNPGTRLRPALSIHASPCRMADPPSRVGQLRIGGRRDLLREPQAIPTGTDHRYPTASAASDPPHREPRCVLLSSPRRLSHLLKRRGEILTWCISYSPTPWPTAGRNVTANPTSGPRRSFWQVARANGPGGRCCRFPGITPGAFAERRHNFAITSSLGFQLPRFRGILGHRA